MDKIAVLIPCLNEAPTIAKVVSDFRKQLPEAVIYVYDNNCTDDTAALALEAGAVIRREPHQGKGNVVRRMFREIDAQCYLMVDGDDTYSPEQARKMCDLVLNKNIDMVIGDRLSGAYFTENKRPFHNFGNTLVRRMVNSRFHSDIQDVMTGYRAFSYRFVKTAPILSPGFEIETEVTIHAIDKNMLLENIVIDYRDRPEGSYSKLNTYSDGFKVLMTIHCLHKSYKPKQYFGRRALVLLILGIIFSIPVFVSCHKTGLVPVNAFPFLSVICLLSSLLCYLGGVFLNAGRVQRLQDFEMALHAAEESFKQKL